MDYRSSGVDLEAGNEVVRRIRELARGTYTSDVLSRIGTFGGLYRLDSKRYDEPVLVSSADGVGTKLKVAFRARQHRTVGQDLVNHCVNDILVQGAEPLFFLDYLATGRLAPDVAVQVVEGLAQACAENDCALIGGETAEMPGFYSDGEYDLAGFIVGVVERARIVDGSRIRPGDRLLGLPSTGLHTNGFSLARRIVFDHAGLSVGDHVPELGASVGEVLLRPHRSYLAALRPALHAGLVMGLAHITGGGITENLPRVLPAGCTATIDLGSWTVPPVFTFLQSRGDVAHDDMYRTFNMGIGMIVVCRPESVDRMGSLLSEAALDRVPEIGRIVEGTGSIDYGGPS